MFLEVARSTARTLTSANEVPVGAIGVVNYRILTSSFNCVSGLARSSAHSEVLVVENTSKLTKSKVLVGCSVFVTLSPCLMCIGVMVKTKLRCLFYSAKPKGPTTKTALTNLVSTEQGLIGCSIGGIKCHKDLRCHFQRLRIIASMP